MPVVEVAGLALGIAGAVVLVGEVVDLLLRLGAAGEGLLQVLLLLLGLWPEDLAVACVGIEDDVVGVRDRLRLG